MYIDIHWNVVGRRWALIIQHSVRVFAIVLIITVCINIRQVKIFTNFATYSHWWKFIAVALTQSIVMHITSEVDTPQL